MKNELCVVMSLFIGEVDAAVLLAEVDQGATYDVPLWMVTSQFPLRIGAGWVVLSAWGGVSRKVMATYLAAFSLLI